MPWRSFSHLSPASTERTAFPTYAHKPAPHKPALATLRSQITVVRIDETRLVSSGKPPHIESMGDVIRIHERIPVTKSVIARRVHQERERALAHAQMMMVGAMLTTALMMVAVALAAVVH